jgi:cytochrome c peroxidase
MRNLLHTSLVAAILLGGACFGACTSSLASGVAPSKTDGGAPLPSSSATADSGQASGVDAATIADAAAPDAGPTLRVPELPPVPPLPVSASDPPTAAKISLGSALYVDTRLSGSGHTACASCHGYQTAFQDNLPLPVPDRSYPNDTPALPRNTSSFYNLVFAPIMRWDGSQIDLVSAMAAPWAEPNMNLGNDVPSAQPVLQQRLTVTAPNYAPLFQQAYGQDITTLTPAEVWTLAGRALAAFVREAVSQDSAFDRWNAGDDSAMSASAVAGLAVFRGKGRCITCHSGAFLTDFSFHNLSTSPPEPDGGRSDEGRADVTGNVADEGFFLTPTLRGVYDTAPYYHDGSQGGLFGVLDFLNGPSVTVDPNHDAVFDTPLGLTTDDETNLVAFLEALRGAPVTINPTTPP